VAVGCRSRVSDTVNAEIIPMGRMPADTVGTGIGIVDVVAVGTGVDVEIDVAVIVGIEVGEGIGVAVGRGVAVAVGTDVAVDGGGTRVAVAGTEVAVAGVSSGPVDVGATDGVLVVVSLLELGVQPNRTMSPSIATVATRHGPCAKNFLMIIWITATETT
jgi:hypothetical protein